VPFTTSPVRGWFDAVMARSRSRVAMLIVGAHHPRDESGLVDPGRASASTKSSR
jgi:hypothetical protein